MKKKRNKKHNKTRLAVKLAAHAIRNYAVCFIAYDDCKLVDIRDGKQKSIDDDLQAYISDTPHKWCIFIAVFCIDDEGKQYIKHQILDAKDPYYQWQLAEIMVDTHVALIDACNPNHLKSVGWIARPNGIETTPEMADFIFSARDIWTYCEGVES